MPQIIDIESCGCHAIHGVLNYGVESEDWRLKKVLKGVYYLLRLLYDSPARPEDYVSVTGSSKFSVPFCATL